MTGHQQDISLNPNSVQGLTPNTLTMSSICLLSVFYLSSLLPRYYVEEHGGFIADPSTPGSNETAMMAEIIHRGPISCSMVDTVKVHD